MFVAMINVHVKPEFIEAFMMATIDNASNSLKESGVLRFDIYQNAEDPTRFTFVEIYNSEDAPANHRKTAHYIRWRDTTIDMMVEPRSRDIYNIIFPSMS